jgi:hypothetical protein
MGCPDGTTQQITTARLLGSTRRASFSTAPASRVQGLRAMLTTIKADSNNSTSTRPPRVSPRGADSASTSTTHRR